MKNIECSIIKIGKDTYSIVSKGDVVLHATKLSKSGNKKIIGG